MSTEAKVIIIGGILTIAVTVGISVLLSKGSESSVPEGDVVAKNGLHWHPNLTINIEGKKQELPANIGLSGSVHQKIHTHDTDAKDGVVHLEAQGVVGKDDIKLGNFFRVWGKEFNSTKILDKTSGPEGVVKMTVNGKDNREFENYLMKDGDKIEISYN